MFFFEFVDKVIDDDAVKVGTTEVRVAVGALNFEDAVAEFQDRYVERTTTEVVDGDLFVFFVAFVQAVSQSSGGWLVDNALDFQAGNLTGVFGGLALGVVKVSRYGNDRFGNFVAQESFRRQPSACRGSWR